MAKTVEVDEGNFDDVVLKSELPVMVDFSAEWCAPCNALAPVVEQIADDYRGKALVAHLDVDNAPELTRRYHVRSVPTLLFFKGGRLLNTVVGRVPKRNIAEALDEIISESGGG